MPGVLTDSERMSITHSEHTFPENPDMTKKTDQELGEHHEFALRLREALSGVGLIPGEVPYRTISKEIDVSDAMLSYMLRGIKLPGLDKAIGLAKRTGVCVEWLLTGRGSKTPITISPEALPYIEEILKLLDKQSPKVREKILDDLRNAARSAL